MSHESPPGRSRLHIAALLAAGVVGSLASIASSQPHSSALIVQKANDAVLARLAGNTPGGMLGQKDLGQAAGTLALPEMALVLRRSPAQEQALARLLAAQQDRASPSYHHWLSPDEFGASYGASAADLATLSAWLSSHGFSVKAPSHGRSVLRFAGTSAQVEAAFHTQIHYFQSAAGRHFANVSDPQIPAAFAPAISGITGLHDFHPAPQIRRLSAAARAALPQFNGASATAHAIGPTDFATIYNVQPLQAKGISGHGSTIAIAAASSINVAQANAFWAALGVGGSQTLSIVVPSGSSNPGETTNEDEDEAYLDVEVAGGVAPAASIILVPSTDALVSAAYAIDNNLAPIVNISFGSCEPNMSAGESQFVASMYQEAAAAGISVVVAAGDQGSAACDTKKTSGPAPATHGFAVNGLASTPYNTAVGGTDFNFLDNAPAQYWAGSNAAGTFASALSYMPETAWNDTCANPVVLPYAPQYPTSEALCNDPYFAFAVAVNGGGGGVSTLYAQPTWQAGIAGLPSTSGRVLPDVSFFAAEGLYSGVSWLICSYANTTCDPAGSAGAADGYELVGGTSAAAPAFAGILALLNQTQVSAANPDGRMGLINPTLYQLAGSEFGSAATLSACNSSSGSSVGASCIFHDITAGGNAMPCAPGSASCDTQVNTDAYGVLFSGASPGFLSAAGFDAATGLGSLDVNNFVTALWIPKAPASLSASPRTGSIALSWTPGALAQTYNVYQGSAAGAESATPVLTGVSGTAATVSGLTSGTTYYFRVAAVNGGGTSAYSNEATATVLAAAPTSLTATAGDGSVSLSWAASAGATGYSVYQGTSAGAEGTTPVSSGTATSATISGLTNGQAYYFTVAANNAGGTSAKSAEASATPVAPSSGGGGSASGGGGGAAGLLEVLVLMFLGARSAGARRRVQ